MKIEEGSEAEFNKMQRDSDRISINHSYSSSDWKSERLHLLIYLHIISDVSFLYEKKLL
jgi:hypothetical protein